MDDQTDDKDAAEDVHERMDNAVEQLATGTGDVRERLRNAALTLLPLTPGDFPKAHRAEFERIFGELTKDKAKADEGMIEATLQQMTNASAQQIAKRIYALFREVQEILRR